jgi:hypothetical protein
MIRWLWLMLATCVLLAPGEPAQAARFISIGTGGINGVYYPVGGAICRLVNQNRKTHGIRCSVEATGGSVYNVENVLSREFEFGLAQSDVQWRAWNGAAPFAAKETKLRSVFSLYGETAMLVVRKDSKITRAVDIRGKRINLGNPGSGQRATAEAVLNVLGLKDDDLALAGRYHPVEQGDALREGRIDGFFYMVGNPATGIRDLFNAMDATMLPLTGPGFQRMIWDTKYYVTDDIPGGLYRGMPQPVKTFSVKATLVTTSDVEDEVVYNVVKAVFDDLEAFRKMHPALGLLKDRTMVEPLAAPIHPGAQRYYEEKALR